MSIELKQEVEELQNKFESIKKKKDIESLKIELRDLNNQIQTPDFWNNQEEAQRISQKAGDISKEIESIEKLEVEINQTKELVEDKTLETDEELMNMASEDLKQLQKKIDSLELTTFLSGKFDENDCILTIKAGQGGTEAMDWSSILMRMYLRYINSIGWKASIIDQVDGQEAGIQTVEIKVEGRFAYGYLKHEKGTHRLVRNSPFNSQGLRQTSFAGVDVTPIVQNDIDIEIKDEDIDFSAVRSGGAGGQNVNKVATKVRLVHKPTGLTVTCSMHRTQPKNREEAMKMLKAQLYLLEEEKRNAEMSKEKGEYKKASWGNQIRNYVLQPYKLVKDLRTGIETSNSDAVLDGDLQQFIDAQVRLL